MSCWNAFCDWQCKKWNWLQNSHFSTLRMGRGRGERGGGRGRASASLWRRASPRNTSFWISFRWPIYLLIQLIKPNFRILLPHRLNIISFLSKARTEYATCRCSTGEARKRSTCTPRASRVSPQSYLSVLGRVSIHRLFMNSRKTRTISQSNY